MLWVWGEPPMLIVRYGQSNWTDAPNVGKPVRRGPPTKKMTIKQAAESHKRHLEKAAARTKKWREKKDSAE